MSDTEQPRFARREVIKLISAAALLPGCAAGPAGTPHPGSRGGNVSGPAGTLTDPDLVHPVVPWQLTLTEDERQTLAVLCDMIIPADDRSPAASTIGAHRFIDEWVSAPYESMKWDRNLVREGLAWLDQEAQRRFQAPFHELSEEQKTALCDDICFVPRAKPEFRSAAHFFDKVRDLTAMAFYTTKVGMDDVGYVGNVPLAEWPEPPPEALRHVGLNRNS